MAKHTPPNLFNLEIQRHYLPPPPPGTDHVNPKSLSSLTFVVWDDEDDHVYAGQFKPDHARFPDAAKDEWPSPDTLEAIHAAMYKVPDDALFPKLPDGECVPTVPDSHAGPDFYTKRPGHLESLMSHNGDNHLTDTLTIPDLVLHEARMLDLLSQHSQHPNIVRYHGYRVRRGFITGLVLDMVPGSALTECMFAGELHKIDKEPFMAALESAVDHLHHVVGIAHNDICPANVMIRPDGMPCLIDFNSAAKIGHPKPWACFTLPWHDEKGNQRISQKRHDLYGLAKLRWLLDHPDKFTDRSIKPVFPTQIRLEVDPTEPDDPNAETPPSRRGLPDPSCPTLNKMVCISMLSETICTSTSSTARREKKGSSGARRRR
ncbi:kinase-like domain-containing protein [Lasiosphaeris hirsuta]|uniref:Kinase-like domain-containing protein n=1 Tax=Lasiosphaeris hirsuta TaxID=260670 RepID=A0AA40DPH9_9PEZI|nr:kinase-like domain-containing protein [Lasiosphaeris hirsuta]